MYGMYNSYGTYNIDLTNFLLIALIIIIPLIAESKIKSSYSKWSKIDNGMKITGKDAARMILDRNGLQNISIYRIGGSLTDHYDPKGKLINLSDNIYNDTSIASVAVAAHECGHAIQDKTNYAFLRFRTSMVPLVNLSSRIATIFLIIGLAAQLLGVLYIGIGLLLVGLLFQLVTLPVEFDASRRAKIELQKCGLIDDKNVKGTSKVLKAAAYTYVAGFISMALQILRLVLLTRNRK